MLFEAKTLSGYTLCSRDGEIGKVKEFYFDDLSWKVRYLVADTGNWLRGRQVLISPLSLLGVDKEEHCIAINLTKKQIEDSPKLESDKPVSKQYEASYSGHYGWPFYYSSERIWGNTPEIVRADNEETEHDIERKSWDPHLRSLRDTAGFRIESSNREVGRFVDLIIDDETWEVRYLIVDADSWWKGNKILIARKWINQVNWSTSKMFVDIACETFRKTPPYTGEAMLTREYEIQVYGACRLPGYWVDKNAG